MTTCILSLALVLSTPTITPPPIPKVSEPMTDAQIDTVIALLEPPERVAEAPFDPPQVAQEGSTDRRDSSPVRAADDGRATAIDPPPARTPDEGPMMEPPPKTDRQLVDEIFGWPGAQLVTCESAWNRYAVGPLGERGLFQVHPIWRREVERLGWTWEQMFEPEPNIRMAVHIRNVQGLRAWACWR